MYIVLEDLSESHMDAEQLVTYCETYKDALAIASEISEENECTVLILDLNSGQTRYYSGASAQNFLDAEVWS